MAAARTTAGLTQQQLAQVVGTTQTRVSDWERGVMDPRPALMVELAAAVGIDALELLGADPAQPVLEDLRLAAGLTQQALAAAAGISLSRYRRIELGAIRRDPPAEVIDRLARSLAVPSVTVRHAIDSAQR